MVSVKIHLSPFFSRVSLALSYVKLVAKQLRSHYLATPQDYSDREKW